MKPIQYLESGRLLTSRHAGSHRWWLDIARVGTPCIEPLPDGRWKATFFWKDPQGSELTSAYRCVWININCLTDHHQSASPQSLQRLSGTDVWYWQTTLNAGWRGSYSFIPSLDDHPFIDSTEDAHLAMHNVRNWWRGMFGQATHDLLNHRRAWQGAKGHFLSGISMPDAPEQPAWEDFDNFATASGRCMPAPPAWLQHHRWTSQRLGNTRNVWVYTTGNNDAANRPLAILLDGQFWAQQMPIWDPLMQFTRQQKLPAAVYLLIDVIDSQQRGKELTCKEDFWLAIQEELLPQLTQWAPHSNDPAKTVVAGQSFGGLSALYAGLHWPQRFGCVLSQSGSFWWPRRDLLQATDEPQDGCWLLQQIAKGLGNTHPLKIFIQAGVHERLIDHVNERLVDMLQHSAHQVNYQKVEGGHDALCWRGGLLDGLQALWSPQFTSSIKHVCRQQE